MASGYFKTVGRPFEGEPRIKTTQKPRMMGKGKEWESEIQPTTNPYSRRAKTANWSPSPERRAPTPPDTPPPMDTGPGL